MKHRELKKRIAQIAEQHGATWEYAGGTRHEKWLHNGTVMPIPRHNEIGEALVKTILDQVDRALEK